MKNKYLLIIIIFLLFTTLINAQVKTDLNNSKTITSRGQYNKDYKSYIYDINPPDTNKIIEREAEDKKSNVVKPFRFAEPIAVNIDIVEFAQWIEDSTMAYGKLTMRVKNAKSLSINFSDFFLPTQTEVFIYNKTGRMITGPISEKENNKNRIWGSSVYKGEELTIELKIPKSSKKYLKLNIENVAFGYKEIYGFGTSSGCNINVLCSLGNGWEQERNSVALILNQNGSVWCTGSLVNNTCNVNTPYFLTANHCFSGEDVTRWRFIFQYWSPTCTPDQDDLNNLLFNGSTLRANNPGSDFALVELSQTPDVNSNISYSGWSIETVDKQQSTIIHHPAGDVMKISRDTSAPVFSNFLGAQCWQLGLDFGATNGGSSGAPYFDQNHRIIGQHYGINQNNPDQCLNTNKFGGRFDISWIGGGTNATRLSNWLDPNNTGLIMTTNTTNIANLTATPSHPIITGYYTVNSGSTQTSIADDTYQQIYVPRSSNVVIRFYITTNNYLSYNWSYDNVTASGLQFAASFTAPANGYSTVTKNVYLDANDGCGTVRRTYTFQINSLGWSFRIITSPNPKGGKLNVVITKIDKSNGKVINEKADEKQTNKTGKTMFTLYNLNTNQLMKQWTYNEANLMNYGLDIKDIKPGLYVLRMERDGQAKASKILIE